MHLLFIGSNAISSGCFAVTTKHSDSGEDGRFVYGVSEMQGWRISMEDAHTTVLNLDETKPDGNAFFAVFDGHGGSTVAKFSGENVHKRLAKDKAYQDKRYEAALKRSFLGTDDDIRADPSFFHDPSGCTAVAALITSEPKIYVANAGDSRTVLSVKGEVKPLSYDHKPQNEVETSRITAAGGFIEFGRVNGNLALSRAIGDFEFKKNYSLSPERQIITADPDIIQHDITEEDEFIVIACDGIWDCLSSQQVVDTVRRLVHDGKELTEICNIIMDICLAPDSNSNGGIGCDNMTVLVVALLNGRTKEEWYAWVKDRVAQQYGYSTPVDLPQIYARIRIEAAQARNNNTLNNGPPMGLRIPPGGLGSLARVLANGGLSFNPEAWQNGIDRGMMFDHDDTDEEESEDESGSSSYFRSLSSLRAPVQQDVTVSLKAQLEELEEDDDMDVAEDEMDSVEVDGAPRDLTPQNLGGLAKKNLRQEDAPPPRKLGGVDLAAEQLKPQPPSSAEPSGAVAVEVFMETSEGPLKAE
ncbi:PP2C-domain-containing protein [Hysterangium stoloniferum]|nr:PP2C-domain-containing protein [Hysterangium stoloniferum]